MAAQTLSLLENEMHFQGYGINLFFPNIITSGYYKLNLCCISRVVIINLVCRVVATASNLTRPDLRRVRVIIKF